MELSLSSEAQETIEKIRKITGGAGTRTADLENSCSPFSADKRKMDLQEIINIDEIYFPNDETWLYECSIKSEAVKDLHKWLYDYSNVIRFDPNALSAAIESKCQSIKNNIDSRTFTRPKKRFMRPRIEDYQNSLYSSEETCNLQKDDKALNSNSTFVRNIAEENYGILEEDIVPKLNDKTIEIDANSPSIVKMKLASENNKSVPCEPLNFDLSEPIKSNIFEKVFMSSQGVDSFQNMSPPSLVNSLCSSTFTNCSSTFTNLMENSYIKNDPILREIRDSDYSSEVLLQDCESPMFHSITGSCSSVFSDTPESFVQRNLETTFNITQKRKSLNNTYVAEENDDPLNNTYCKNDINDRTLCGDFSNRTLIHDNDSDKMKLLNRKTLQKDYTMNMTKDETSLVSSQTAYETVASRNSFNSGTYVRNKSSSENATLNTNTYRKPTLQQSNTFRKNSGPRFGTNLQKPSSPAHNHTNDDDDDLNSTMVIQPINDTVILTKENEDAKMRRLSYVLDDNQRNYFAASNNLGETVNLKCDSVGPFGGSEDSLDQMSSLSSSSKGSNKMLNMADVDAIVQQQERSLQDISTPKPNTRHIKELWDGDGISPIISIKQQRDQTASDSEIEREDFGSIKSSTVKLTSVGSDTSLLSARSRQRNIVKITNQNNTQTLSGRGDDFAVPSTYRKFPANNKNVNEGNGRELRGSYTNLAGSQTNLNSVPRPLKGSYTNLNPVCVNLLAAAARSKSTALVPDMNQLDITAAHSAKTTNRFDDLPSSKENQQVKNLVSQPSSKSNQVRPSGLPRPVSMCGTGIPRPVSRIPAPRCNVRPLSSKSVAR